MSPHCTSKIYIYPLIDPFTNEVRYIGKTCYLKQRLQRQCCEKSNTYRCHWIQSLMAQGKRPIQEILEELEPDADWQTSERKWIAYGRAQGWRLTNSTDGGDGVLNLSGESKERMLKTWKGRKHRPESLAKMSAASSAHRASAETRVKMSKAHTGREITPEWRENLSQAVRKLTDDQVRDIRKMLKEGYTQKVIAAKYGVHKGTISHIYRNKFYTDVPDMPD